MNTRVWIVAGIGLMSLAACAPQARDDVRMRNGATQVPSQEVAIPLEPNTSMSQVEMLPGQQITTLVPRPIDVEDARLGEVPVRARLESNQVLHFHSNNDRFLSPMRVTLREVLLLDDGLEFRYRLDNPSAYRRILDPRGLRSSGNVIIDSDGQAYPASSQLVPVAIPPESQVSYSVRYPLPTATAGERRQIVVRPGLDDVTNAVVSSLVPFALSLPQP